MARLPGWLCCYHRPCDRCGLDMYNERVIRRKGGIIHVSCASGQDEE